MGILDRLKKRKKIEEEKVIEKPFEIKDKEKPKEEVKSEAKKEKKIIFGETYRILKAPHLTEKATSLAEKNQYVFKVWPEANKIEIKKAIEDLYGAEVVSVKIIKVPRKRRRLGRISGWGKGYKKAIVKIKEGQKIEIMPK